MWCYLPVLSAQFITAPTGSASDIRNLAPTAPPRPAENTIRISEKCRKNKKTVTHPEPFRTASFGRIRISAKEYDSTNCIENTNKTNPFNCKRVNSNGLKIGPKDVFPWLKFVSFMKIGKILQFEQEL
jgi:hypothetical protein